MLVILRKIGLHWCDDGSNDDSDDDGDDSGYDPKGTKLSNCMAGFNAHKELPSSNNKNSEKNVDEGKVEKKDKNRKNDS